LPRRSIYVELNIVSLSHSKFKQKEILTCFACSDIILKYEFITTTIKITGSKGRGGIFA